MLLFLRDDVGFGPALDRPELEIHRIGSIQISLDHSCPSRRNWIDSRNLLKSLGIALLAD
jgi:hypothetical protein